ncbi:MAG: hypothetical protein JJE40_17390 [Vicinamibacteria bacterium]|nr:hypothetical protein [Vicinamibacteria bacterium]
MTAHTTWMADASRAAALVVALAVGVCAQTPSAPGEPVVDPERMSPREVQRLFDAYVAMQAQERLQLSETQYPQFLPRLKALLDLRRSSLANRQALVAELGRASLGGPARRTDEAALGQRLQQLRAFDEQTSADLRRAYEAIDQVLDLRQQARFRVFEDQIERRKVELLMRARQNVRNRAQRAPAR